MTGVAVLLLVLLGILHLTFPRTFVGFTISSNMVYDVLLSLAGIAVFVRFFTTTHQDNWSYGVFLFALMLHNVGLYENTFFGLGFDRYMHFVGGLAAALVADRLFANERWGRVQRFLLIVLVPLGCGAAAEIVEWFGYATFGAGDGFLLYGAGDIGEWQNASLDMFSNLVGALTVAVWRVTRKS